MVSHDEVSPRAGELRDERQQPVLVLGLRAEGEVAHDPEVALVAELLSHALDQRGVHVVDPAEGAPGMGEHRLVPAMWVSRAPMRHEETSITRLPAAAVSAPRPGRDLCRRVQPSGDQCRYVKYGGLRAATHPNGNNRPKGRKAVIRLGGIEAWETCET